jgi:type IV secretion system protein VirB10
VNEERKRAAAQLRQTSLAADPNRARKNLAYTAAGAGLFVFFGLGLFAMRHNEPAAPSSTQEKPKIDESHPQSAPLDPSPKQVASATSASAPVSASSSVDPEVARSEQRMRERRAAEAEQARKKQEALLESRKKSALFVDDGDPGRDEQSVADQAGVDGKDDASELSSRERHRTGSGPNDANSAFARAVANESDGDEKPRKIDNLQCKVLPGRILQGKVPPRTISDLPGSITVVLDSDTYGEKGRIPVMPWGTRIVGKVNSQVRKGQQRVFIATATAYRPDGVAIHIDSPVSDQLGTAGIDGEVDNHVGQILGMSAALSLLSAGASNYGVSGSDQYNSQAQYRTGVQQSMAQSSQQLLDGYANIPPTLKTDQGTRVRIQVEHVLDFSDYCIPEETDSQ